MKPFKEVKSLPSTKTHCRKEKKGNDPEFGVCTATSVWVFLTEMQGAEVPNKTLGSDWQGEITRPHRAGEGLFQPAGETPK